MQNKIYIRVDGSAKIGLGHLIRCNALADMLKDNFDICFVCKEIPESIYKTIAANYSVIKINAEDEFKNIPVANDIVLIDHYGLDGNYQRNLKENGCKVVCIDDLHDKEFFADLIINHAPDITPEDYRAQPYTKFALGLKFALLRPAFLKAAKQDNRGELFNTVFICFGGADPDNLTLKAVNAVIACNKFEKIKVVVGGAYNYIDTLKTIKDTRVKIYSNLLENDICKLMQESCLAIVPSSSVLIEAIACGLKIITCYYTDNQKIFHDAMVKRGISSTGMVTDDFTKQLQEKLEENKWTQAPEILNDFLNIKNNYILQFNSLI